MAVPGYQSLMLPMLKLAGDGAEHSLAEAMDVLAREFHLDEADRREPLPSGPQPKFDNRVGWARTYLVKAGLLTISSRGKFTITPRGREVLASRPAEINVRYLRQFREFREFQGGASASDEGNGRNGTGSGPEAADTVQQTPEEQLAALYQGMRQELALDLLSRIKASSPRFFEQLVVDLLVAMGYGGSRKDAGEAVGQSGDGGIDGIIKEDKLGLDVIYIQAKRWDGAVGRPIVQAFAGSLEGQRARKGVLITTSHFSQDALDYVTRIEKKIVLIDGRQLAQYMIDHGIGVTEAETYTVSRVDLDYFSQEQ